jgi:predicted phage-related endonuclease
VPTILGLSTFRSPLGLWSLKVGLVDPASADDATWAQKRGHHMETLIARQLEAEAGVAVEVFDDALVRHADGISSYSPDGVTSDGQLCEFKSSLWGRDDWSEGVPQHVFAQVQHGLYVLDLDSALVAVDLGSDFRWAAVERDAEWYDGIRPQIEAFAEHVRSETAPEPTAGDKAALDAIFPHPKDHGAVAGTSDDMDDAWLLLDVKAQIKELEGRKAEIENRVRAKIGEHETLVLPDGASYSWKLQSMPERVLAATEYRVLRYKKGRGR